MMGIINNNYVNDYCYNYYFLTHYLVASSICLSSFYLCLSPGVVFRCCRSYKMAGAVYGTADSAGALQREL